MGIARIATAALLCVVGGSALAGTADPRGRFAAAEWGAVGGDWANSQYSALDGLDRDTVRQLGGAWTYRFDGETSRATPVIADGRLFVTAGAHVYAFDPRTGALLWKTRTERPPFGLYRGVAYGEGRVYVGLTEGLMAALDAATGAVVWSRPVVEQPPDGATGGQWFGGSATYAEGLVIAPLSGARAPIGRNDGRIVAVDAKTGEVRWTFHVVPGPGEPGHETWPQDSDIWKRGGGATWTTPAVDPGLGLVFAGTGNAMPELGGAERPGDNLYTASVVALDLKTGRLRWHYQLTRHDIWEMDLGTPLLLFDGKVAGRPARAVAAMRTDGYLFLLDRATGRPLHRVEERPVPQDPGLKTAPTQPFPVDADPVGPRCIPADMIPAGFYAGCFFDPIRLDRPNHMAQLVSTRAAPMAYSPRTGLIYVASGIAPTWLRLWPDPYVFSSDHSAGVPGVRNRGLLTAIDAATLRIRWQKQMPWRIENGSGATATAGGLLFHGEPDGNLQAYDAATGDLLWQFQTGAPETGPAALYRAGGETFVAVATAAGLWAFKPGGTLPPAAAPPPPPTVTSFRGKLVQTDRIAMSATFEDPRGITLVRHYTDEYAFKPQRVKVTAGTTVTWTNEGSLPHDASAEDGSWSTGPIAPGASAAVRFDKPGTYTVVCREHPWSYGQLVVE
jgi:glucose dehydrogenase/plastocyanin